MKHTNNRLTLPTIYFFSDYLAFGYELLKKLTFQNVFRQTFCDISSRWKLVQPDQKADYHGLLVQLWHIYLWSGCVVDWLNYPVSFLLKVLYIQAGSRDNVFGRRLKIYFSSLTCRKICKEYMKENNNHQEMPFHIVSTVENNDTPQVVSQNHPFFMGGRSLDVDTDIHWHFCQVLPLHMCRFLQV
jgi:ribosomal protein L31